MRDEQFEKDFLKENVIPFLFSRKSGNLFRSVRNVLDEEGVRVSELQSRYGKIDREDTDFWIDISEIISESFDVEPSIAPDSDFKKFIQELITIRFDKEFRSNDIKKLDSSSGVDDLRTEIDTGENLVLEDDDSNVRIIYVGERTSREYIEPLQPTNEDYYPPLLISITSGQDELQISGDKSQRNQFVSHMSRSDQVELQDEEPESYDELEIDPDFIHKLRDHDIVLKNINISGNSSDVSLSVSSDEGIIHIEDFVDYDLLLQNRLDLLTIRSCEFVYIDEDEDVVFEVKFNKYKRTIDNQRFIKISLEISGEKERYRDEIEEILEGYGIETYEPYFYPISYYFNKIITTNSNYRRKYYDPMIEMEDDSAIDYLTNEKVITEDGEIEFNKDVLGQKVHKKLSEVEKIDIEVEGRQHRITEVEEYKKSRVKVIIKSYSDNIEDDHRHFYRVVIPINAILDKFEKIYNVVLSRINYYELLTKDDEKEVIQYIVRASQRQIKYRQKMLTEKEARRSAKILVDYYQSPENLRENFGAKRAGYKIEDHLNVPLRYIFRDYLPGGGSDEPDGGLRLNGTDYLIDSKQSKEIPKTQLSKAKEDIEKSAYTDLVESDRLVFIVSKELLFEGTESGSLNPTGREKVSHRDNIEFYFISVEFICNLYDIFSENMHMVSGSTDVGGDIYAYIQETIEESRLVDDCNELENLEKEKIGSIRKRIDEAEYLPEDKRRHF